jgi:hypothetical protein
MPGVFLAGIGDNWEIYLNGTLIQSEMHVDENGKVLSHRSWRGVAFPVEKTLFKLGTNLLVFRIVGAPSCDYTGLYYL